MPTFKNAENLVAVIHPEGDYVFEVIKLEIGQSTGAATNGSDKYELTLRVESTGGRVFETLIDHESCAWKIDCFLKSTGVVMATDESFEFCAERAAAAGVAWVDPVGLRGWCKLIVENYTPNNAPAGAPKKQKNKVAVFYTDREKLPPKGSGGKRGGVAIPQASGQEGEADGF